MKRIVSVFILILLLAGLSGCTRGTPTVSETFSTPAPEAPSGAAEAAAEPTPTLPAPADDYSRMAWTFAEEDGTVWTCSAEADGLSCLPKPFDIGGTVENFLFADGMIYAAAKTDVFSLDPAMLLCIDPVSGTETLLAENLSPACTFCLVGSSLFYEAESGIWALDLNTGLAEEAISDGLDILSAQNGYFYYTRTDGALYRNDRTLAIEQKLLDEMSSLWLTAQEDGFCCLSYTDDASAVLLFCGPDGTVAHQQVMDDTCSCLYADGENVYAALADSRLIRVYDFSTGEPRADIPLPEDCLYCLIRYVSQDSIYYESLSNGMRQLCLLHMDTAVPEVLADITF